MYTNRRFQDSFQKPHRTGLGINGQVYRVPHVPQQSPYPDRNAQYTTSRPMAHGVKASRTNIRRTLKKSGNASLRVPSTETLLCPSIPQGKSSFIPSLDWTCLGSSQGHALARLTLYRARVASFCGGCILPRIAAKALRVSDRA